MAIRGQHMVLAGLHAWVRFRGYRLAPRDLRIGGVCAHPVLAEVVGVKGGCPYEPQHVQASVCG